MRWRLMSQASMWEKPLSSLPMRSGLTERWRSRSWGAVRRPTRSVVFVMVRCSWSGGAEGGEAGDGGLVFGLARLVRADEDLDLSEGPAGDGVGLVVASSVDGAAGAGGGGGGEGEALGDGTEAVGGAG